MTKTLTALLTAATICLSTFASPLAQFHPRESYGEVFHNDLSDTPRSTEHHILFPRHHPEHDAFDHVHLVPDQTKSLFWSQNTPNGRIPMSGKFASSMTTFKHPTVVLDHSMHVITTLRDSILTVKFPNFEIFVNTTSLWTDLPMLLITAVGHDEGHLQYLLASSIDCQDLLATCLLNVTAADFEQVADEFVLTWGHHEDLRKRAEAPWSSNRFDQHLDSQLGYYTFEDGDTEDLRIFAEGLTDYDPAHHIDMNRDYNGIFDEDGNIDLHIELPVEDVDFFEEHEPHRSLQKRNKLKSAFNKATGKVTGFARDSAKTIVNKVKEVPKKAKETVQTVKEKTIDPLVKLAGYVTGTPMPFSQDWSKTVPETKDNPNPQQTFKKENGEAYRAKEIYKSSKNSKIEKKLYCLECGVQVTAKFTGELAYKIGSGVQRGNLKVDAGLIAQLLLGFEAGIEVEKDLMNKRVAEFTIPGLGVPGIISIGPMLTLDAKAVLKAGITGNVMVGGTLDIKYVHEFDLKDTSKKNKPTITGPKFKSIFNAEAEISAGITISTPIGLAIGLSIGNEKLFGLTAGIYSEPAIEASAKAGISYNKDSGVSAANDCKGVKVTFEVQHALYAQASAKVLTKELIGTGKYIIHEVKKELPGTACYGIKGKSGRRAVEDTTTIDMTAFNLAQSFIDIDDPVDPANNITTPFDGQDFVMPAAVEQFVSDQGPPMIWSDPAADPMDTSVTTFNYTFISDERLEWDLVATAEGNLGVQSAADFSSADAIFEVYLSVVVGDALGRVFVYFSGEIEKYNVSRIRLEPGDKVPHTSKFIGLVPITHDSLNIPSAAPKALLVPTDTAGRMFYTVLCAYKNQNMPSKLFIVSDVDSGIATLTDSKTDDTITGGAIEACTFWPMINGLEGIV